MYLRIEVIDVEFIGGCSNVAFLVPVCSLNPVEIRDEHVVTDVEFSVVVEEGSVNVRLDYECFLCFFLVNDCFACFFVPIGWITILGSLSLLHQTIELVNLIDDCYSSPLIAVLSGFYDPYISCFPLLSFSSILFFFFFLFHNLGSFFVILYESGVLRVFNPFFYMESERDIVEGVFLNQIVVLFQIVKKSFLIPKEKILRQMVMNEVLNIIVPRRIHSSSLKLLPYFIRFKFIVSLFIGLLILF